jgi:hypothetical protein
MTTSISLARVVDALESVSHMEEGYLNLVTGEVVIIGEEEEYLVRQDPEEDKELADWQQELVAAARHVQANRNNYIELPSSYDLNEYAMMRDFCYTVQDERLQDKLLNTINGSGAFSRFKQMVFEYDLRDKWFAYRDDALIEFVIGWLEFNEIPYTNDVWGEAPAAGMAD